MKTAMILTVLAMILVISGCGQGNTPLDGSPTKDYAQYDYGQPTDRDSQNPPPGEFGNPDRQFGPRGGWNGTRTNRTDEQRPQLMQQRGFQNMTDEQRQQMMQQRQDQMKALCDGKSQGDACTMTSPRGDRQGTCDTQNDTLLCTFQGRNPNLGGQ